MVIFYQLEPKKQRFGMSPHGSLRNAKVYELKEPDSLDGKPSGFNISQIIENKIKLMNEHNVDLNVENAIEERGSRKLNKKKKYIKQVELYNESDVLPLVNPDPFCEKTYAQYQTKNYCLQSESQEKYFEKIGANTFCLKEGMDFLIKNGTQCHCKLRWHGQSCSMHDVVYTSEYPRDVYAFLIASEPKRIINALPFTHEFDLLEARMHELADVVDLFLIVESNYTAAGHPRPRLLQNKLNQGYLQEFHYKILYVPLGYFPQKGYYNGWIMDALLRNYAAEGLKQIQNLKENDILVINDADELPKRETLLFLKLHDGYPEPIGFNYVHNVYGFYWRGRDKITHAFGACSIAMLLHFFNWEPYRLRSAPSQMNTNKEALDHYKYKHRGTIREWSFGHKENEIPCGWHCSWCFRPQGIKTKLEGAHWSDLPRWGAFPSKTTLDYIANLTINGLWFDDRTKLLPSVSRLSDWYAPQYVKSHFDKYQYLLVNKVNIT